MSIEQIQTSNLDNFLYGLSSDTKPETPQSGTKFFETDTNIQYVKTSTGWVIDTASTSLVAPAPGAALAVTELGESGTLKQGWMRANTSTPVGEDGAVISDATGYKAFRLTLKSTMGAEGTDVLAVGWSTTAADSAAIAANLVTFSAENATQPEPAVLWDDVAAILRNNGSVIVRWDGTNTIKTIAVRAIAGAAKKLYIEVVE